MFHEFLDVLQWLVLVALVFRINDLETRRK